jgi:hypothetical protein
MLTDEERRKIIEEEQLRIQLRMEHYNRPVVRPFLGKVLVMVFAFAFICAAMFLGSAIILFIILNLLQNKDNMNIVVLGSFIFSIVTTPIIWILLMKNLFKRK